ncbi:helix-turn-helix domain-containing protein [Microbacterium sp. T32]|uniref:helix-turn-helix domain-containing protein n=1 Tax=Microbacterium sp. T32 TaxID=1776083 RepID=UPI000AAB6EB1|nr:helix-turn-helix domain-containing protein [Microbacterium sp. T32]
MLDLRASTTLLKQTPRLLRRRLSPDLVTEIVEKYRSGATTPSLCAEYSVSKGGLLKLLRDHGVQLRCQPLSDEQIRSAAALYEEGKSLAAIAASFGVSYNGVRQALAREGIERRPRGGSRR